MPSLDLRGKPHVTGGDRMLYNQEIDISNADDWSNYADICYWLAALLKAQPEVATVVYIKDWGQGDYGVDVLLKDGTPLVLRFTGPEIILEGILEDEATEK